jgi:hypothetical protein
MSDIKRSFVEGYLAGELGADAIDDFIDRWHAGEGQGDLAQYLGFTQSEYAAWVERPDALPRILEARRQGKDLQRAL